MKSELERKSKGKKGTFFKAPVSFLWIVNLSWNLSTGILNKQTIQTKLHSQDILFHVNGEKGRRFRSKKMNTRHFFSTSNHHRDSKRRRVLLVSRKFSFILFTPFPRINLVQTDVAWAKTDPRQKRRVIRSPSTETKEWVLKYILSLNATCGRLACWGLGPAGESYGPQQTS